MIDKISNINQWRRAFLVETLILFMSIRGRINFLQLARYGKHKEQRYRQKQEGEQTPIGLILCAVATSGALLRKLWSDELPMLINLFRGDLKLVGVRPLSKHYYELYSKELQEKRIKYRPGLVPPYYADMPETLEEIQATEMRYLEAFEKHPLRTQWRYFWKAWKNILFKRARSA